MKKILWIDLEMTGLDPKKDKILEIGAIVTDLNFAKIDSFECVIKQPKKELDKMGIWCKKHHKESGLIERVKKGISKKEAEKKLTELIKKNFDLTNEKIVLAGNSIHIDRRFVDAHLKKFSKYLHYRMLDVSSLKILFEEKYKISFKKKNKHRAIDDLEESISELKSYIKYIKV